MDKAELLIGGLLVAIAGLGALARRISVPYPIVLVVGGVVFGFIQAAQIVLGAQRDALVELRREGRISNETMNRVIQELDLEESRLEI